MPAADELTSPSPKRVTGDAGGEKALQSSLIPSTPDSRKQRRRKKSSNAASPAVTAPQSRSISSERHKDSDIGSKRKRSNILKDGEGEPSSKHARNNTKDDSADDAELSSLFFIDLNPISLPSAASETKSTFEFKIEADEKLILPSHVTVMGNTPFEIVALQPPSDSEEEDFIKYLDYDDTRDAVRYYHEPKDEAAILERTVCKKCGAEGQHKTSACPHEICLTCGARDEHSTRSCPISKVCFTCGMKGHINATCPNRGSARALMSNREHECDRCSASTHRTNECPTWWRLYEYVEGEDQARILALRQSKKDLKLGDGGEGYVADDDWCYNCGNSGHWGDDCSMLRNTHAPEEHSAFSKANVMKGPFYDPDAEPKASTSRSLVRDWDQVDKLAAIDGVGRQGRQKSKAAMQKQARRAQADDDRDDWFANSARQRHGSSNRPPPTRPAAQPKKISFGKSIGGGLQLGPPEKPGPPSLLARMGMGNPDDSRPRPSRSERREHRRSDNPSGSSHKDRHRDRDRHRDDRPSSRHDDRARQDSGPRYRGGYGR